MSLPCGICGHKRTPKEAALHIKPRGRIVLVCAECYHAQGRPPVACDLCHQPPLVQRTHAYRQLEKATLRACQACCTTVLPWLQEDTRKAAGPNGPVGFRVRATSPLATIYPDLVR